MKIREQQLDRIPSHQTCGLSFASKSAFVLTAASLLVLIGLSLYFKDEATDNRDISMHLQEGYRRHLDQDNNDGSTDYSSYSCRHIYSVVPEPGDAQCQFARTCNDGDGIWASFVFCHTGVLSTRTMAGLLSPIVILWLVLLFRMLGSTAEDYFSPALEMFSVKLGLPPRFAGVTLLALGNGAADVSATVSAITGDAQNGYKLSLGALTGAAMFIGGVVSASVILVCENGVRCRGALVRDVAALFITVLVVWKRLRDGVVGPESITLFLSLYIVFVILVFVADVYHRTVVLPRMQRAAQNRERQRQFREEEQLRQQQEQEQQPGNALDNAGNEQPQDMGGNNRISTVITALSNYDNAPTNEDAGWGVESDDLAQDRPIMLHGSHGILSGDGHVSDANPSSPANAENGGYSILDDTVDGVCVEPGSLGASAESWYDAYRSNKYEFMRHVISTWDDIVWNGDVHVVDKFLQICEFPFTMFRKTTVPIPCEGYYVRSVIAFSLAFSPLWFALYLYRSSDVNVLNFWEYYLVYWAVAAAAAAGVVRFAPGGEGNMAIMFSIPIALYGFVMAATWIDTIADTLVSVLSFVGIMLSIPPPVLGLTLLAWGNSMSDLSANMTMARKGLANMAMTACFAGPVFNILVGLGLGFSSLAAKTGVAEREVGMSPSVLTGFLFIALNTASILVAGLFIGKGVISQKYGYVSLVLYAAYVVTSICLQYSKYGDDE